MCGNGIFSYCSTADVFVKPSLLTRTAYHYLLIVLMLWLFLVSAAKIMDLGVC